MIKYKIDLKKIDKNLVFKGDKGTYVSGALFEYKEGTNEFGNDGYVVQDVSQKAREAGERGPIIGNWKYFKNNKDRSSNQQGAKATKSKPSDDLDDLLS